MIGLLLKACPNCRNWYSARLSFCPWCEPEKFKELMLWIGEQRLVPEEEEE